MTHLAPLGESAQICSALARFCPTPCWIYDQIQILFISQPALDFLGLQESQVLGRPPGDFAFPTNRKEEQFTYQGQPATFASFLLAPESHAVYEAIGQSIAYGVWLGDALGETTYLSQGFLDLVGMSMEECKGFGWTKALRAEDREPTAEAFARSLRTGENLNLDHWLCDQEGSWHPVLLRAAPARDQSGQIIFWAGVNLDVGRYKDALQSLADINDQLTRANQELEEFAFTASHDLQEPLRVIRLMAKLVEQRGGTQLDAEMMECLQLIEQSTDRMSTLVRAMLDYARVLHALPVPEVPADLNRALAAALQNCAIGIQQSGAAITWDPMPTVIADQEQITRVFQNLISNAVKYRRDVPLVISITVDERGTEWRFCVSDNGRGIPEDFQRMVFLPFKRLQGEDIPGSGLGLAVCQKIIEYHGGRIWAESEPGEGSLFFFTLPMD